MRRTTARLLAVGVVVSVATLPAPAATSAPLPVSSYRFAMSGLEGGGFQNAVVFDPFTPGIVLAGGDVSGVSRSTDGGRTWTAANLGIPPAMLHVATLVFSTTVPGRVYAGVGKAGRGGGLLLSEDFGRSWRVLSTVPQFSGTNNAGVAGVPSIHPRSTGSLVVADDVTGTIHAGTFDQGVLRSADGGVSWTPVGLAGSHVRSLVADPASPSTIYAATYEGGVFRSTVDSGLEPVPGSPGSAEELVVVDGTLYAAAGTLGLFRYSPLGAGWDRMDGSSLSTPGKIWTTITGYTACGSTVLYAGSDEVGSNVVVRSADGGATWSGVPAGAVHTEVGGPGGHRWWLADRSSYLLTGGSYLLTGGSYLASQLAVAPPTGTDPCRRPEVVMAGRSGLWGSTNEGANWYPYVERLGTTFGVTLAADGARAGRVLAGVADWAALSSVDGLETVLQQQPSGTRGAAAAFLGSTAYLATGDNDTNSRGELWSSTDLTSSRWRSERLGDAVGGKRAVAVSARSVSGTTVLLAAVQGSGVWRKAGGAWKRVSATAGANRSNALHAGFAWLPGSSVVFLYDNRSGLWRSTNAGLTWQRIWTRTPGGNLAGGVAADPTRPGTIYVSAGYAGLYRLDGAGSSSVEVGTLRATRVLDSNRVGPVAVGTDGAVLTALPAGIDGTAAALLRSIDRGSNWSDVADDTYRGSGGVANALAFDVAGRLYVSLSGNGVVTGVPLG